MLAYKTPTLSVLLAPLSAEHMWALLVLGSTQGSSSGGMAAPRFSRNVQDWPLNRIQCLPLRHSRTQVMWCSTFSTFAVHLSSADLASCAECAGTQHGSGERECGS